MYTFFANNFSANMSNCETIAFGTCLINENAKNFKDLFEPDYEVLPYKSNYDCYDKIKFCLLNPQKAYQIGITARKIVIDFQQYSNRLEIKLVKLI